MGRVLALIAVGGLAFWASPATCIEMFWALFSFLFVLRVVTSIDKQ